MSKRAMLLGGAVLMLFAVCLGVYLRDILPGFKPQAPAGITAPATEFLFETTQTYNPGQYVYKSGSVFLITEVQVADPNTAALGAREFLRSRPREALIVNNELVVKQPLPPGVSNYRVFGKKLIEITK